MVSALANPNMPPLMSPESQSPGLMALGKANFKENMADPAKNKIAMAMMGQGLGQLGKGLFGAQPIQRGPSQFDMNGNPIG
jgi:hypothetical protein